MFVVLLLLLVLSATLLVWGVISPRHLAQTVRIRRQITRKHTSLVFGCLVVLFLILFLNAMTVPQQPTLLKTSLAALPTTSLSTPTQGPGITTKDITQTQVIPYTILRQKDIAIPPGQTAIGQAGKDGVRTLVYQVVYTDGKQTSQKLISNQITSAPIVQIVNVGPGTAADSAPAATTPTEPAATDPTCHPSDDNGNCYEPGDMCTMSEQGESGVAGNGDVIMCVRSVGTWRWQQQ